MRRLDEWKIARKDRMRVNPVPIIEKMWKATLACSRPFRMRFILIVKAPN
jgi:hypothetical protein